MEDTERKRKRGEWKMLPGVTARLNTGDFCPLIRDGLMNSEGGELGKRGGAGRRRGETSESKSHTQTQTLPEDASGRHVFLCFDLGEVEGARKNESVHKVDEALQEGD